MDSSATSGASIRCASASPSATPRERRCRVIVNQLLERARRLEAQGEDEAAKAAYLELLGIDGTHFAALNELGNLALATGHRTAAQTAYRQAVQCHPQLPMARVNLGNLLYDNGDFAAAREQYAAALSVDAALPEAHQGLARTLTELGETAAAEPHWRRGFAGHALVTQRYRGAGTPVRALLTTATRGGNIPLRPILDDRIFAVTALHVEFHDPAQPLPPHDIVINAIGDADLCAAALQRAATVLEGSTAAVINPPARVLPSARAANAARLARLPGVIAPTMRRLARSAALDAAALDAAGWKFPLLLRAPGFHTGRHFLKVERRAEWAAAVAALPGEELLAIEYLDARGADGMARKYRVMFIDGALYPLHLAVSADWKVHYFTAAMSANGAYREEERRFLDCMPAVLGTRAMTALAQIAQMLGLDYGGIDFALAADGSVQLFEANATMAIVAPDRNPVWDYRRPAIARVIEAARQMILARAAPTGA